MEISKLATSNKKTSNRTAALDALIATYAPIGVRQQRKQRIRRASFAGGAIVMAAAVALLSVSDVALIDRFGDAQPRAAAAMSDDDIARLARERVEFNARIVELENQIADVRAQKSDLQSQRAEYDRQSERLARLLDETDNEQSDLQKRQQQGSQLDREIAAIAAQRKALEERWAQFEAQGELLAMEIIAVNAQRKELESQRRQIDRQQKDLAEMLERADGLYRDSGLSPAAEAPQDARTAAVDEDAFIHTPNSLMVANTELDSMRGGFRIGTGLGVSFGFAQTGSINGVEQFKNSFTIDSVGSGFQNVDMSNMNSVLLQNGNGNFVSTSVLDSLADSFGNIIQNTLDDQVISTTTIYDISLQNVPGTLQGLAGEQALMDSLSAF